MPPWPLEGNKWAWKQNRTKTSTDAFDLWVQWFGTRDLQQFLAVLWARVICLSYFDFVSFPEREASRVAIYLNRKWWRTRIKQRRIWTHILASLKCDTVVSSSSYFMVPSDGILDNQANSFYSCVLRNILKEKALKSTWYSGYVVSTQIKIRCS